MLVSVIIPVYQVEGFLRRAVDSVLAQTLADFELYLVDDGSKDGSGAICDAYALRDSRVHVLHQPNQGAPAARNAAIALSQGKYRYFCDADDYMEPTLLEKLVAAAEKTQAEWVLCGYAIETDTPAGVFRQENVPKAGFFATKEEFRRGCVPLFDANILYPPWNKLYLASYMDARSIRFPATFWDDFPFNLAYMEEVSRVAVVEEVLYHFTRARGESETAKYVPQMYVKRQEEDGWMRGLFSRWGLRSAAENEFLARRYAERLVGCIENLTNPRCSLKRSEKLKSIREMLNTPRAREALSLARPRTLMLRCMLLPLKWRWVWLAYAEGKVITFAKQRLPHVFARLKAIRGRARA